MHQVDGYIVDFLIDILGESQTGRDLPLDLCANSPMGEMALIPGSQRRADWRRAIPHGREPVLALAACAGAWLRP